MNLMMNFNNFVKLKDFFKLTDIGAEVVDYSVVDNNLEGVLFVQGKYVLKEKMIEESFNKRIPFSIMFTSNDIEVDDILCESLDTVEIDGRGIDINFDIKVDYEIIDEIPVKTFENVEEVVNLNDVNDTEENIVELVDSQDFLNIEEIKEAETKRMDELLKSTLVYKDDNLPTQEAVARCLKESKSKIKVCYYQTEKELERVSTQNNISLNQLYEENKENDINKYRRVIINDKSSY